MRLRRAISNFSRAVVAFALVAHLLLIMAMAVNPALHEWIHHDADHDDHECAVTLFAAGGCEDAPPAALAPLPEPLPATEEPAAGVVRVAAAFHLCGVLEHAPPRRN